MFKELILFHQITGFFCNVHFNATIITCYKFLMTIISWHWPHHVQGDVSRPSLYISPDNHLVNSYTYEPPKDSDRESIYVPSLEEVIKKKKTSYRDSEYYEYYSDEESEDAVPTHRLSLSESVGGSFIKSKLSQLRNVLRRADDTLDAVFTLLVPGKSKSWCS